MSESKTQKGGSSVLVRKALAAVMALSMCIMLAVPSTAFAVTYHTLYLDANGGEWSNGQKVLSITRDTKTPTVTVTGATQKLDDGTYVTVTLKNHKFVGWNTLANGLGCSYKTLPVNFSLACADKTLYAMWEYSPDPVPDPEPISGSITYNLNDAAYYGSAARNGGVEKESLLAGALLKTAAHYSDDPASTLAPTLQGYIFTGWYLDPEATQPAADAKIPEPHVGTKIAQIPAGGTFVEAGIVWRVLVNDGSEVIVISNDVIEKGKWNDLCKDVPWSDSTIRTYLNNTFYNRLSADFQSLIVPQTLTTRVKAWATCYDKYGTEQTVDKVFLLSAAEAFYVGTDNALIKNACYPQLTTQTAATRFNGNTPLFYSAGARAASSDYWLRDRGLCALLSGAVTAKGAWTEHTVTSLYGIRPVMVLDVSDYVDDPNLNVTVYAGWEREKNGRGPTMTVPSPQEITATTAAEAYDPIKAYKPDGSDAVSAIDDDGRDVTDEIVVYRADGTTLLADDPIYTNEPDIYVLKYVVTGSDDETSEAWRVVVINDGSYVVDSKYVLQAKPFSVPFEDAPTAVADTISLAQAKAWDISNPPALPTTEVIVTNDGGYKQYPATYNITYAVKAKASVAKTVAGTLTGVWDKVAPIISATSPVEVAKWSDWDDITGVAATDADNVTAWDNVDLDITDRIIPSGDTVDTQFPGFYKKHYSATDNAGNTGDKDRLVVVNDGRYVVQGNILEAWSFVINIPEVSNFDFNQLRDKTEAKLYKGEDGSLIPLGASVINHGGYHAAVSTYPITVFGKDAPSGYIFKNVWAKVVDADVIAGYEESDNGNRYYTYGDNVTIEQSVANDLVGDTAGLEYLFNARGAEVEPDGDINDTGTLLVDSDFPTAGTVAIDDYSFFFTNDNVGDGATVELTLTVTADSYIPDTTPPELTIPSPINLIIGTEFDPITGVEGNPADDATAWDDRDEDVTDRIVCTDDGGLDVDKDGVYVLRYEVTDLSGNKTTDIRVVLVNDGTYTMDKDIIHAGYAVAAVGELPETQAERRAFAIERCGAKAWDGETGLPRNGISFVGTINDQATTYTIQFSITDSHTGKTVRRTVNLWVYENDALAHKVAAGKDYYILANNPTISVAQANALVGNESALLLALDARGPSVTPTGVLSSGDVQVKSSQLPTSGTVDPGVYEIVLVNKPEVSGNSLTVYLTVE